jgi:hypothetical protein
VADDRQPGRREPPASRVVLLALAAAGLVALVAVGSLRGPLGRGGGRPSYPADLVDSLILLVLVAAAAAGVLALTVLLPDRHRAVPRARRSSLAALLLPMLIVVAVWLFTGPLRLGGQDERAAPPSTLPPLDPPQPPAGLPRPGWLPLLVACLAVLAVAAVVGGQLLAERRRRGPARPRADRLVELLGETLDDIERELDPRRAVIAAWARMERGLAAAGLPRHPAEAPFEYAGRVLEAARVSPAAVHRLTDLFERAKFSHHAVEEAMREEAVAALRAVRRELAEAAEAAEAAGAGRPSGGGGR